MRVIHLMGADSFTDPETSTTYEAGDDGVFDLPEPVGTHYVTKHAGMFRRESDHEALVAAKKDEALSNPHNTAPTLKALLGRVTVLEDKVAAWESFFGGDAPEETKASDESDKKSDTKPEDDPDEGDESDAGEEPGDGASLRKPTPRKTASKRRS